jgi:cell wall-associated NlpC family hydrolase
MKIINKKYLILVVCLVLLIGCGHTTKKKTSKVGYETGVSEVDLNDVSLVKKKLYSQYEQWKGVKYKHRGLGRKGIDCSGFVYITFKSKLGLNLPRTTELQSKLGIKIDRKELRSGDLVFFKTGLSIKHVGIYLERGLFLHASTSKGVMISELRNVYWKSKFWKVKRITQPRN